MPNLNKWDPNTYSKNVNFVPTLGKPVIDLLAPKAGERILDLGCGTGVIAEELMKMGCSVLGADASPDMVSATRERGVEAIIADAQNITVKEKFDAVFSNAALHWMSNHYAVVRRVWDLLRPGGRFVGECGGEGCLRIIREGMKIALIKRGIDYRARNPWHYPELGTFSMILTNQGFDVKYIARFDRPTPLPTGLRGWLEVFAVNHTAGFTNAEKESFYEDVEDYCRPMLYKDGKGWIADYKRLRFYAVKPAETEEAKEE